MFKRQTLPFCSTENAGYGMNKLASWETLTGTRPTIESDRTIATVSFPLKSAIQRKAEDNNVTVNGNDAKNVVENVGIIISKNGVIKEKFTLSELYLGKD